MEPVHNPADASVEGVRGSFHRRPARPGEPFEIVAGDAPVAMWVPAHHRVVVESPDTEIVLDIGIGISHDDSVSSRKQIDKLNKRIRKLEGISRNRRRKRRNLDRWRW